MAFWGVEINQRKPYTLSCRGKGGRLRITQATLGFHTITQSIKEKVVLQCKVGDRNPIRLCSLIPESIETFTLNLEFEEKEEVVFSVSGNRSVHLSGYNTGYKHHYDSNEDTLDSCGKDIAETESEQSSDDDFDNEEYESNDSFINDGDPGTLTPSPQPKIKTKEVPICLTPKFPHQRKKTENPLRRRLIKKYQVGDSQVNEDANQQMVDNKSKGVIVMDSEDEDDAPICTLIKRRTTGETSKNLF